VLALVLGALVIGLAAVFVGVMVTVRHGITFFRTAGEFGSALDVELTALDAKVTRLESTAASAGDTAELERSLARLASSRARLAVLQAAWNDDRAALQRLTAVMPRK
jgi:hypothetical protein